ncbi:MAG TPA: alanine--glyoxylate aminotransferase family protein [Longimicrobiaceae bacterium]|nr:alanine--glyoxylate aminotransferase family protein [Longimicrobiaceae bacterium]
MTDTKPEFGRFFLTGPTEVHPRVLEAMTRPVIGHRGPAMTELLREVDAPLRAVFRTSRPVYVSSSSATGLMEAAVRCGVRRRALALVNGAFSGRFRDLVGECGREVETCDAEWGAAHDPDEVFRRVRAGGFDAVTVVHSETSTGVLQPLAEIADAVRAAERETGEETLLLVDGVTSVGGAEVEAEAWGLDLLLTGSQKALALPPGLAFATAMPRFLERAASIPGRGQYFDLVEFDRAWARHQTPNTPAVSLVYALAEQVKRIQAEGIGARVARHRAMAERCWEWVETAGARWGLRVLAPQGFRSPTNTAVVLPPERKGTQVAAALEERGWTIAPGYGRLRDSTFRIGHMGDHTVEELDGLLAELEEVLG